MSERNRADDGALPARIARSLPELAAYDEANQMGNAIKVATSGIERAAPDSFWASGKWRMVERVRRQAERAMRQGLITVENERLLMKHYEDPLELVNRAEAEPEVAPTSESMRQTAGVEAREQASVGDGVSRPVSS